MSPKKRGLGRGLEALLTTSNTARQKEIERNEPPADVTESVAVKGELKKLPVEWLTPGKYQPRKDMSPEALDELANSIRSQGVIQPIVVRPLANQSYEIIAGERRWRASQLAELERVPCLIKDVDDEAAVAIALIENIQREDLNAMEEAIALQRLLQEFELTHQQVADAVGKSRTAVTNLLRLNSLQDGVKTLLEHGDIEMGHARALLALQDQQQEEAARSVAGKGLSVRDTEKLVKKMLTEPVGKPVPQPDPNIQSLQQELAEQLGAKVEISCNSKGKGRLVINYTNLDELDGILAQIKR